MMDKIRLPFIKTLKDFLPLKQYFIDNRYKLLAGVLCLLAVDFLQLMVPMVLKKVVDSLTLHKADTGLLFNYAILILSISLAIAVFRYLWRICVIGHSRDVEERLRNRLFSHIQTLSMSFFQKTKTGDIMARSINDINAVRMATGIGLVSLTDGIIMGFAAVCFMLYISPSLTALSLIPAPVLIYIARVHSKKMSSGHEAVQKSFSSLTESVRETFSGIRVVKSFAREKWAFDKVKEESRNYVSNNIRLVGTLSFFFPMMAIFTNLGLAIVILFGGRLAILGDITTGDFVAFIGYLNQLSWPIMAMGWVTNLFQRGGASMRRISGILGEDPDISSPENAVEPADFKGIIRFDKVYYRYQESAPQVLKDISFEIKAGQTVSIVGKVGSGKSTLLYLIPRLIDPQSGLLSINGIDLKKISLASLRKNISFVTQDAIIFSDTIKNNITFGRDEINDDQIADALKCAGLYDDVTALEKGIFTVLGEKGITLSGGQKQRLTIARAIAADPQVLILDDSLSMIDTRTEERILNDILNRRNDSTNIIISHRLSTISRADNVIVMADGKIIEQGNFKTLIDNRGEFCRLYEKQFIAHDLMGVTF